MAQRNVGRTRRRSGGRARTRLDTVAPWVFPFDRARHERARALLGPDSAGMYTRPAVTAELLDFHTRQHAAVCRAAGHNGWGPDDAPANALRVLIRLADVAERHLALADGGHVPDTLALAELAVAHRRRLAQRLPATQRPLLGLSLVLLTHQLHSAGRFGDAVATGQEAVDILARPDGYSGDVDPRPALVLALDASLMTCLANGRLHDATDDLVRATHALDDLHRDAPEHHDDLARHVQVLAMTVEAAGSDGATATAAAGVTARWDLAPRPIPARGARQLRVSTRSAADDLCDEGLYLATSDGDGPAAAAVLGTAVTAYRRLLAGQPAEQWYPTLRRLARGLWRHAIVLDELLGRPRDAIGRGREALAMTRRCLRAVECAGEFDDLVGELGVTLHDVSTIALRAGLVAEHDQLAEEIARLDEARVGATAMRSVGATLHRRAAQACETTVALAERRRDARPTIAAGVGTSGRAMAIRRALLRDDSMSRWELANSQLAHGHLRCLDGDGQGGAQAMADAYRTVRTLTGPAGHTMRNAAEAAVSAACATHPHVVPRDDWPI